MSKPKSVNALSTRLATLLVEAMNHPKSAEVLEATAQAAFEDSGAESRHSGDLVVLLATIARHVCESSEGDCGEMSEYWAEEAESADHEDHSPAECEKYSSEYEKAAGAYFDAGLALSTVAKTLEQDLTASGI